MAELLLEILGEETPARMQARAAEELERLVRDRLQGAGLPCAAPRAFVTPRRLVLVAEDLPARQADVAEERKGPRVGAPLKAVEGFLKAAGLASLDEAEVRADPKGDFYVARRTIAGQVTAAVLPDLLASAIASLGWPKSMRWAAQSFRWVRPIQSLLVLFDGRALEGSIDLGGAALPFGRTTAGHRFLAPASITVTGFADYQSKLREAFVVLDQGERRRLIAEGTAALAAAEGLVLEDDPGLLDEVTGLVEWPQPLIGRIAPELMVLPPEVLIVSMRSHQRYFALRRPDGALADRFVLVSNMDAPPGSPRAVTIVAGNERVLRARLADALFFWDQDRQRTLESRLPALQQIVFHARLGSLAEKVQRVAALARYLAGPAGADPLQAERAARLAKADLTSGMVGEFPELQGVMGRYYARNDGEPAAVAEAIAEHYSPLGPADRCPSAALSVTVALADKLDTLIGFWAIDEKPTGSKDPFALRRAALGAIRLIVENRLRLPLLAAFDHGQLGYHHLDAAPVGHDLLAFFADRLKVALREQGVRHDLISAVFALGGEDDLVRLLKRVEALTTLLASEDGANLLTAYRRAANIVRIEGRKDGLSYDEPVDPAVLVAPEEIALHAALAKAEAETEAALAAEDFTAAMAALSSLRGPVDAFFDKVTVNTDEPAVRANRLRLLSAIGTTLCRVAVFGEIEG